MEAENPAEADVIVAPPPVLDVMWIGFNQAATHDRVREEGFKTFDDLSNKEKDIRSVYVPGT